MFLTFNELSTKINSLESEEDARQLINELVLFVKAIQEADMLDECLFPETLFSLDFYRGYNIARWLSDTGVPASHRQYFRRFLDKYRRYYSQDGIEGDLDIVVDGSTYRCLGGAFAYEHDCPLLSLSSHDFWRSRCLPGTYIILDSEAEVQSSECTVDNLWTALPTEDICDVYKKKVLNGISSGLDLWNQREKLYPNLIFCESVRDQLFEDSEKYHIAAVMARLTRLQEYFSTCDKTYDPKTLGMQARTESDSVKDDPKLKSFRLFKMPDNSAEYFYDHVGFRGKYGGGRIYFLPDNRHRRCYIGYIGRHLPTRKY